MYEFNSYTDCMAYLFHQFLDLKIFFISCDVRFSVYLITFKSTPETLAQVVDINRVVKGFALPEHEKSAFFCEAIKVHKSFRISRAVNGCWPDDHGFKPFLDKLDYDLFAFIFAVLVKVCWFYRRIFVSRRISLAGTAWFPSILIFRT